MTQAEEYRKAFVEGVADDLCFKAGTLDDDHAEGCEHARQAEAVMKQIENEAIASYLEKIAGGLLPKNLANAGARQWLRGKIKELKNA